MDPSLCETCWHFDYDEEAEDFVCLMALDEDEFERAFARRGGRCPFYRKGDDYTLARRQ